MLQHSTPPDGSFELPCTVHVETRDADQRLTSLPTPVRAWPAAIAALAGDDGAFTAGWDTLDASTLRALAPHLSIADATRWAMLLSAAMDQARINTPARRAAFLAQVLIETEYFKWLSESGWIVEESARLRALGVFYGPHAVTPRKDVITAAGTAGPHYYGRGLLMRTGRDDYAALSHELYHQGVLPDRITSPTTLLDQPQLVAQDDRLAVAAAVWQFTRKSNCHAFSDRLTAAAFAEITHALKGHRRQSDRRAQAYSVTLAMFFLNVMPGQSLLRIGDREVRSLDTLLAELRHLETGDQTVVTLSRTDWVDGAKLTTTWTSPSICR